MILTPEELVELTRRTRLDALLAGWWLRRKDSK